MTSSEQPERELSKNREKPCTTHIKTHIIVSLFIQAVRWRRCWSMASDLDVCWKNGQRMNTSYSLWHNRCTSSGNVASRGAGSYPAVQRHWGERAWHRYRHANQDSRALLRQPNVIGFIRQLHPEVKIKGFIPFTTLTVTFYPFKA